MRLTEIPGLLADPAASSPGATLGWLSFGYFSLPSKESDSRKARNACFASRKAKARSRWIPAFAGMTVQDQSRWISACAGMTAAVSRSCSARRSTMTQPLPGVLHTLRHPIHTSHQHTQQRIVLAPTVAPALQQVDLQQADRIDIGIAQADRQRQALVVRSSRSLPLDRAAPTSRVRANSRSIRGKNSSCNGPASANSARDAQIALGQHHLDIVQEGLEERPVARHFRAASLRRPP